MATGRRFAGNKLPLSVAFTVLVVAAIGAGCKGFFTNPTLNAVSIQPPSPQVQVGGGNSITLQAWGTYSDNSRAQIKSGVAWSSSGQGSTVDVDPNTGVMTGVNTGGTATITAAAQGISGTAQATAYLGTVTQFQVCLGTFGSTTCSNGATALSWNPDVTNTEQSQPFIAQGLNNGAELDLTTNSTWTITTSPASGTISCTNDSSPAVCTVTQGATAGTYVITVTYGTNLSATINVTVIG
jgi:hypothetical protein